MTSPQTPAGWYPDPNGTQQQRYWDGSQWTEHYAAPSGGAAPAAAGSAPPVSFGGPSTSTVSPAPTSWWAVPALAVLALIGAIGLWVSAELGGRTLNETNGTDGDGSIMLVLVVIAVVLLVVWRQSGQRWSAIVAAVLAAIATLLPLIYIIDPSTGAEGGLVDVAEWSTGWGAYVSFLACAALTVLAVVFATKRRRA